ncbi:MAG TPA: alpha/beta hydrolase-fold protein, partial [Lachnospiraceae bacterium]|nr:alpha/beta hydrolase-fold protein [Lachnospiraceae bacterium]
PVVYLTDCYWRRENYGEIKELYESGRTREFILIGIGYPDNYDFDVIRVRDLINDPDSFLSLIVNGIMPYAEGTYSVDASDRTFCGASYGGNFMLYSLFQSDGITKGLFKNYVMASPIFYKRSYEQYLFDYEEAYYKRGNTSVNANVYMTVGEDENILLVRKFKKFTARLERRNYTGLNLTAKVYEGKEHYTVWVPTLLEGLKMFLE